MSGLLAASGAMAYGGLRGARLNRYVSETQVRTSSTPGGYVGKAYVMAVKAGGIAAVSRLSLSPVASGALGLNAVASIPMGLDFTQANMGLVSQGVASITFSITTTPSIVGVLSGAANFTGISMSLPAPTIGALSGLGVTMPMSLNVVPSIRAKAYMSASITNEGAAVTPTSVAAEVWNTVAAAFNTAGTMGNKMNSAASAGDPWTTLLPGAYGAGSAGVIIGTLSNTINQHTTAELAV